MEAILTPSLVKLIDKNKFMQAALNKVLETFVVYMTTPKRPVAIIKIHSIRKLLLATLEQEKALTKILIEYSDFADLFSANLGMKLLDYTRINKPAIKLV